MSIDRRRFVQQDLIQRGPSIIPYLLPYLESSNIWILSSVIEILGEYRQNSVISHILPFLYSHELLIIRKTAYALAKIGDPCVISHLVNLVYEESWYQKQSAAEALTDLLENGALEEIIYHEFIKAFLIHGNQEDFITVKLKDVYGSDLSLLQSDPTCVIYHILERLLQNENSFSKYHSYLLTYFHSIAIKLCEVFLNQRNSKKHQLRLLNIYRKLLPIQTITLSNSLPLVF